jgi:alkylhydroperoxidase family enzyme
MELTGEKVATILDDWRTAPIDEKLRVTLGFLEKVTLTPWKIEPEDITPLRAEGVSEQAIEDALVVCALFNIIDRMADALDVAIPSAEGFARTAERLLEHGYL